MPSIASRPHSRQRVARLLGALVVLTGSVLGGAVVGPAHAAPSLSQVAPAAVHLASLVAPAPASPTQLYLEDFEDGTATGVQGIESYTGSSGATYTADSYWLRAARCNGFIVQYTATTRPAGYCSDRDLNWTDVRVKTYALGLLTGSPPTTNRAVSSNSSGAADNELPSLDGPIEPSANLRQFATTAQLAIPVQNRYITFSVDAAATACLGNHPLLRFSLRQADGTEVPVSSSAIDPCSDPRSVGATVDGVPVRYGRFAANGSTLLTTSSIGIVMRNEQPSSAGNDGAFDNIRVLDVTPALDKSFSPDLIGRGGVSRLTFTVTNTSELAAKDNFSLADALPAGVELAPTPDPTTDCGNGVVTGSAGGTTISLSGGDLALGQASCTIAINVTGTTEGTHTNGAPNMTTLVGLNPPPPATLTVRDPRITVRKDLASARRADYDQFTMQIRTGSPTGPVASSPADATTAGTGSAVDPGTGTTGAFQASAGTPHFVTEAPAGSTTLSHYRGSITCVDHAGLQTDLPTGESFDGSLQVTPVAGADLTCVLTNTALTPKASIRKEVSSIVDLSGDDVTPNLGDGINYRFTVSNTGNVTLSTVVVNDPLLAGRGITVTCSAGPLSPGGSTSCTAEAPYVITQVDVDAGAVTNAATATADTAPGSPPLPTVPPSSTTTPILPAPAIALLKTADRTTLVAGQTITYSFTVTNTGNVTLSGISVTETAFSGSGSPSAISCPATILAPKESTTCTATYAVSQGDVDAGSVGNTATGSGTPPSGPPVTSPPSSVQVPSTPAPGLSLVKSAALSLDTDHDGAAGVGDRLSFSFAMRNTGDVTLKEVVVADRLVAPAGPAVSVSCPGTVLAPGAGMVCTSSTYTVTQADVDAASVGNSATVSGTPPSGPPVTSPPSSTSTPTLQAPGLSLRKSAQLADLDADTLADVGERIVYRFDVRNTGNLTLTEVTMDDGRLADLHLTVSCPRSTVAPGESMVCTSTPYTVTQADLAAGRVLNVATATGDTPKHVPVKSQPSRADTPTDHVSHGALAFTGTDAFPMVAFALLLVGGGAILLLVRRRDGGHPHAR